jgi:hypothetical protein
MHDALQCLDDDDDDDDDHTMYTLPSIAFRTHIQLSALCSIFGLRHVSSHQSSGDRRCVSASLTNQNPRSFAELSSCRPSRLRHQPLSRLDSFSDL